MKTYITPASSKLGLFKVLVPFKPDANGNYIIRKADTAGVERDYLIGEASNLLVDKQRERVSKKFLDKMKSAAVGLNVFAEHSTILQNSIGYVSAAGGSDESFIAETCLEPDNELVEKIKKKVAHGTKLAYSIGGRVRKVLKDKDDDGDILVLDDGDVYELSVTAMPAGNVGWLEPLRKSMTEITAVDEDGDEIEVYDNDNLIEALMKKSGLQSGQFVEFLGDVVSKTLAEMIKIQELDDEIREVFWTFREAIYRIVWDASLNLSPQDKEAKIMAVSQEFATSVRTISEQIAEMAALIAEQLASASNN